MKTAFEEAADSLDYAMGHETDMTKRLRAEGRELKRLRKIVYSDKPWWENRLDIDRIQKRKAK